MPVQFGGLHDHRSEHRIEKPVDCEQVGAVGGEQFEVVAVREVESAGKAREQHPERENVPISSKFGCDLKNVSTTFSFSACIVEQVE